MIKFAFLHEKYIKRKITKKQILLKYLYKN